MSQSVSKPTTGKTGPGDSSTGASSVEDAAQDSSFLSLRKTAEWHDISPSHLSRRVREGKSAKGHDLCSYVLFDESEEEKKVFGFSFPPGYEPADSAVGRNDQGQPREPSENRSATVAVRQRKEPHRTEGGGHDLGTNGSLSESSTDEVSRMKEDVDDLIEEVRELRNEEKERLRKLRKWLRERFSQLSENRKEDAKIVDKQFDHLDDRISGLREWVQTVVDGAKEDLEWSREQALQNLSDELQEEIRDSVLGALADDDEGENLWANRIVFTVAFAVLKILDKRPDLIARAAFALGGGPNTGKGPLSSSSTSGEGQGNSDSPNSG